MFGFNFSEQIQRRLGIDRLVKPDRRLQGFDIHGPVDIQSLTAAVGLQLFFLSFLDPAIRGNTVVLRRGRIGKINRVLFALPGLDSLLFFKKGLLLGRVLFAGNMRGFLVGKVHSMQQIRHTAKRAAYPVLLIDRRDDRFGVR